MIKVNNLSKHFGGIKAVDKVNLHIKNGSITGLIGPNGAGVNSTLLRQIGDAILRLNSDQGYTFCMIEHDMDFISKLCNPVIVLTNGKVLIEGTPEEVKNNEKDLR